MSLPTIIIQAGSYTVKDFYPSEDGDFVLPMRFYDDTTTSIPSVLTGRTFSFEIFNKAGSSIGLYEIGSGITVVDNLVTVLIELEDWDTWTKNCDFKYEFKQVLSTGIRYPLLKGIFRITT